MVEILDKEGIKRYSIDNSVYKFLQRAKEKVMNEDQEVWIGFGGNTGVGKSLKAQRWLYAIYPDLNIKDVCFDKPEFINAVINAKKGQGIIADEAISIFFSRSSMTKEGRLISELVAQIRQKNLLIFLCIPEVLTLDWTILSKLVAYCHVYESRQTINGKTYTIKANAKLYPEYIRNKMRTKIIEYFKIKRRNPAARIKRPRAMLREKGDLCIPGKVPWYPVGEQVYKSKKEDILKKYTEGADKKKGLSERDQTYKLRADKAIYVLAKHKGMSELDIVRTLNMPNSSVHRAIIRGKPHFA